MVSYVFFDLIFQNWILILLFRPVSGLIKVGSSCSELFTFLSTTCYIYRGGGVCVVKIMSRSHLQLINMLWREAYSYLTECVPFNLILLRLYFLQWYFKRWRLRYEASNTCSLFFKWFFQNVCFREWILECVETNFLNIFYLGCTSFLHDSISSDNKTIETDVIYIYIYIYLFHVIIVNINIVSGILFYLWILCESSIGQYLVTLFVTSNLVSTISTLVIYLVYNSPVWIIHQTGLVIFLHYIHN